jgi:hypothetical protein
MRIELDHLFVCTAQGALEADALIQFGLREGTPNRHQGQGTANRRFAFADSMLEFIWVEDPREAQSESTRRTSLWERWSGREQESSPFGFSVRPTGPHVAEPPFPAWEYRPSYLPDPLCMHIGDADVAEPMWIYMGFMRAADRAKRFVEHPIGIREITGLRLTTPCPLRSSAAQRILEDGILSVKGKGRSLLEIEFDGKRRNETVDFRPQLPLIFQL